MAQLSSFISRRKAAEVGPPFHKEFTRAGFNQRDQPAESGPPFPYCLFSLIKNMHLRYKFLSSNKIITHCSLKASDEKCHINAKCSEHSRRFAFKREENRLIQEAFPTG